MRRHADIWAAVERHEGELLRYAHSLLRDLETARDVVQDTFVRLCQRDVADQPDLGSDHLRAWLFRVCRNRALDLIKKRKREASMSSQQTRLQPAPGPTQAELSERNDSAAHVMSYLDRLTADQQEVVRLKFQNGLSYKEIAGITNLSVSNVGYLIHTGVQKLRQALRVDLS